MKYEFEEKKLNINETDKLKGELRKELGTPQGDVAYMDVEDVEKVLQKKRQEKRRKREEHENRIIDRQERTAGALEKIADGINGFVQKRKGEVQKVAGDVVAKVSNFPEVQKITGDARITNLPDVQKVEGKVMSEVTNWPEQKDIEFPDVQKVEVLNQNEAVSVSNLPVGEGEEAGRGARPERYVPVRLTNGKSFYNALQTVASAVGSVLPFKDTQGKPTQANVDANGNLKVSLSGGGASGTQYTEGDTDASITGTVAMWEDTGNTLRPVSADKPLPVAIISGAGSGGTASDDDADFTAGTTSGTPAMGVYESSPSSVTNGDLGVVGITQDRRLKTSATIDAALPAGTNNIGDVDIASSVLPTGAATSANQTTLIGHVDGIEGLLTTIDADTGNLATIETNTDFGTVKGGGTETGALRVTLANNSTGVLSIDDNGSSITVDGTVTANLSATDNSVLDSIDTSTQGILADTAAIQTAVETIDNAIQGTEMQVDVVAALPAGTNNIGDVDVASVPRSQSGPGEPGTAVDSYTHAAINLSEGSNQVLVSSAASKQIWVYGIGFTVSAAGSVSFQDEDDTAITGVMPFAEKSGMTISPSGNFSMPIWKLATNKDLEVDIVTADVDGWIDYAIVSVS